MAALRARGIQKAYGGVVALRGVDFAVHPGRVHGLLGENGAGKSTLVKIMTGAVSPDAGTITLDGSDVRFRNSAAAAANGVAVVAQELSLFPHLDILDNLFTMREPRRGPLVDRRRMRQLATPVLEELGVSRPLHTQVGSLTLAERQLVEIAKALVSRPRVLLLDEPTSALETGASERLLAILRVLRDRQVGVVYVSHILEEVMSLCDEVTVLRDGRVVLSQASLASLTMERIVNAMLGRSESTIAKKRNLESGGVTKPAIALAVTGVSSHDGLAGVSFEVASGEIVGLAGLAGSGPEKMLAAIAGLSPIASGHILLPGGKEKPANFRQAVQRGVAYVSGDRRRLGLMLDKPIWENVVQVRSIGMANDGILLDPRILRARATALAREVGIRASSLVANAGTLSGGNQQKVVIAKWMDTNPSLFLLDDPTRGVDVGARREINTLLRDAATRGAGVIYVSTDLEELVEACDRVLVFHRGSICGQLGGSELSAGRLLALMNTGEPFGSETSPAQPESFQPEPAHS